MSKKAIGLFAATSIVIANMIGTGVFTSLGFQVLDIHSVFSILLLWVIGGILALCGALSYGELGAALPRSGGEYHYLSVIYHPVVGFLSGWVSALVGFAAPVALAAMALGSYSKEVFTGISPGWMAAGVVTFISLIHATQLQLGVKFQNVFTSIKVLLCLFFIMAGFLSGTHQDISILPKSFSWNEILSPAFAVALIYVSYAYSGWNASAYLAGEIENPQKNLPRSLFRGTLIVLLIYVLLNFVFLYTAPIPELAGKPEVGFVSATYIFGDTGGRIMAGIISLLLVSTISSMIIAGPRITQVMGEDIPVLNILARKTKRGTPANAIILQSAITLTLIFTSSFEKVLTYVGFTLNLFTFFTVLGLIIMRYRYPQIPRPYKTWGYPLTPILFLLLNLWILINIVTQKPYESLAGLCTILLGLLVYFSSKNKPFYKKPIDESVNQQ